MPVEKEQRAGAERELESEGQRLGDTGANQLLDRCVVVRESGQIVADFVPRDELDDCRCG